MKSRVRHAFATAPPVAAVTRYVALTGSTVFSFHRVLSSVRECPDLGMVTSTVVFEAFLNWAKEEYCVISLLDLVRAEILPNAGKPFCAITFDDGWLDTFTHAFPLMRKKDVTATIFLPVRFIGTNRQFWQDRLDIIFKRLGENPKDSAPFEGCERIFPWWSPVLRAKEAILELLLHRDFRQAEDAVSWMEDRVGVPAPEQPTFMDWDQVAQMMRAGFAFGSHTLNHVRLAEADSATAENEIVNSRGELESILGKPVLEFCYPWGQHNAGARQKVRDAGYEVAVTTACRLVGRTRDNYKIPRVGLGIRNLSHEEDVFSAPDLTFQLARAAVRSIGTP
jgi:peptidoglycan/xylan/chitin deacetylase (PgdA/CDA1 family)